MEHNIREYNKDNPRVKIYLYEVFVHAFAEMSTIVLVTTVLEHISFFAITYFSSIIYCTLIFLHLL